MKKILYYLTISTLLFASCKKEQKKPASGLQKVSFTIAGFSQSSATFNASPSASARALDALGPDSLKNYIANLSYFVYDASGKNVAHAQQTSSQASFGSVTEFLNPGPYTALFIGGQTGILISAPNTTSGKIYYAGGSGDYGNFQDTFVQTVAFTVGTSSTSQNVILSRIDAELEVNIQDQIPAGASYISLVIGKNPPLYLIGTKTFDINTQYGPSDTLKVTKSLNAASIGTTNYNLTTIVTNTLQPFTVTITCYGSQGILASQVIPNVTCQANKKTLLTGNLFGGSGTGGGFQVSVDSTWNPVNINVPFAVQKKAGLSN